MTSTNGSKNTLVNKRPAQEFWTEYRRYNTCPPKTTPDPHNAFAYGVHDLDGLVPGHRITDRFDLPDEVARRWNAAMDAYQTYVDAVSDFDTLAYEVTH